MYDKAAIGNRIKQFEGIMSILSESYQDEVIRYA